MMSKPQPLNKLSGYCFLSLLLSQNAIILLVYVFVEWFGNLFGGFLWLGDLVAFNIFQPPKLKSTKLHQISNLKISLKITEVF
jgi:hypothetical protein